MLLELRTSILTVLRWAFLHILLFELYINRQGQNDNFRFLLDRLEDVYGLDHPVIHYIAAVLPVSKPLIEKYTINELRDAETRNKVNAISTFYVPPKALPKYDRDFAEKMGILEPGQDIQRPSYPSSRWMEPAVSAREAYGITENAAIVKMDSHMPPTFYKPMSASTAMKEVMIKLALDPKALTEYKRNPTLFSDSIPGLSPVERAALREAHESKIISSMKGKPTPASVTACVHILFIDIIGGTDGLFIPPIFLLVVVLDMAGRLSANSLTSDRAICV